MNNKPYLLSFKRIWWIAVAVGLVTAGPVAFYANSAPWLITFPIAFGAALVVILEYFIPSASDSSEKTKRIRFSLLSRVFRPNTKATDYINIDYDRMRATQPVIPVLIGSQQEVIEEVDSAIETTRKVVLMGPRGSGKSTIAMEFCYKWGKKAENSPALKKPVLLQFSQAPPRTDGIPTLVVDMVAQSLSGAVFAKKASIATKMINDGSLCFVFDELDYLNIRDLVDLEELTQKKQKNSFLCILNDKDDTRLLRGFDRIRVRPWTSSDVRAYIEGRIEDVTVRIELLNFLEERDELEIERTPFQWSCLVDLAIAGRPYEAFLPTLASKKDYEILDCYLNIVLGGGSQAGIYINELGRFSLRLLKQGRRTFMLDQPETAGLNLPLAELAPRLFTESSGVFTIHGTRQVFMAAKYLASCWPEAKKDISDGNARALIWTPLHACAREMMPQDSVSDLDKVFRTLWEMNKVGNKT